VGDLSDAGGINLLVFVIKCGGSIEIMRKQYGLLHHGFCDSKVPIVIVVTGCENVRPNVDTWWINNQSKLTQAGMLFDGHACMSAFTGRNGGYHNKDLVEESVEVVRRLVVQHCMSNSWKMKKA
jgi:hypothetical protein